MSNEFEFYVPIEKTKEKDGHRYIVAKASDTLEDQDGQMVSVRALNSMAEQIKKQENDVPIELLNSHRDAYGFAVANDAWVRENDEEPGVYDLYVEFRLKENYAEAEELWDEMEENGSTARQLSVGGKCPRQYRKYVRGSNGQLRVVLDDLKLNHVTATRGHRQAANLRTGFIEAIEKAVSEDLEVDKGNLMELVEKDIEPDHIIMFGRTGHADGKGLRDHSHEFALVLDADGNVVSGMTSFVNGHAHDIEDILSTVESGKPAHNHIIRLRPGFRLDHLKHPEVVMGDIIDGVVEEEEEVQTSAETEDNLLGEITEETVDESTEIHGGENAMTEENLNSVDREESVAPAEEASEEPETLEAPNTEDLEDASKGVNAFARFWRSFTKAFRGEEVSEPVAEAVAAFGAIDWETLNGADREALEGLAGGDWFRLAGLRSEETDTEEDEESSDEEEGELNERIEAALEAHLNPVLERLEAISSAMPSDSDEEEEESDEEEADSEPEEVETEDSEEEVDAEAETDEEETEADEETEEEETDSEESEEEETTVAAILTGINDRLGNLEDQAGVSQRIRGDGDGEDEREALWNGLFDSPSRDAGITNGGDE